MAVTDRWIVAGRWTRRTDGRLSILLAVLVICGVVTGAVGVHGLVQRAAVLGEIAAQDGPLAQQALDIYQSVADADAVAADEFLDGVNASPDLHRRFEADIAAAMSAINSAALLDGSRSDTATALSIGHCSTSTTVARTTIAARLDLLSRQLAVYSGLVETARVYNRLALPLGTEYLELASTTMRSDIFPQAQALYATASTELAAAQREAAGFPWLSVLAVLVLLVVLVAVQFRLSVWTRRRLNVGLLGATLAVVIGLVVLMVTSLGAIEGARTSQTVGTARIQVLAVAEVEALQARADETVVQILQGNGGSFETAFVAQSGCLRGQLDAQADRTLASWVAIHDKVVAADATGDYATAVGLIVGPDAGNTSSLAAQVTGEIGQGITSATTRFDGAVAGARDDLAFADVWFGFLFELAVVGMAAGLWPRIGEYR